MSFYNFDAVVVHCWKCHYTQIHPLVGGLQCVQISDPSVDEQIGYQKKYPQFGDHKYHLLGYYVCEHCYSKVELDQTINTKEMALLHPMEVIVGECNDFLYKIENQIFSIYIDFLESVPKDTIYSSQIKEALVNQLEKILQREDIINILDKGKAKQFANMGFTRNCETDYEQMAFEDVDEEVKMKVRNLFNEYTEFCLTANAELKNIKSLFTKKIFYVIREVKLCGSMNFNPYISHAPSTVRELELPIDGRKLFEKTRIRLVDFTSTTPGKNLNFELFQDARRRLEIMQQFKKVFQAEIKERAMLKISILFP